MTKAFLLVAIAYVLAGAAAIGTGFWFHTQSPIVIVGLADLAATIVIFLFSVATKNSSLYDPYWSVAPVPIAFFWLSQRGSDGFANVRHVLIFTLLCVWAIRLTVNWATQWCGLGHEDWRYLDIQKRTGLLYWPVSFLGIHLLFVPRYPCFEAWGGKGTIRRVSAFNLFKKNTPLATFCRWEGRPLTEVKRFFADALPRSPDTSACMAWQEGKRPMY